MCGRQCLTLAAKDIQCACKYKPTVDRTEQDSVEPEWRAEYNLGRKYEPSHNIAPTDITPVLVSAKHFDESEDCNRRIIVPMMWGMIPFWHKGDYRKHGLSTNNCRLETMLKSKLYSRAFSKGQRCIVLCEGFYEWQTTKPVKKPSERAAYFIHMPQESEEFKVYNKNTWNDKSIVLLKMAGLYDIWTDSNGDKIYSYSVITYDSNETLSWLHDRMPAILETEDQISDWLDFARLDNKEALSTLKPTKNLRWYQVSNEVNNSRNKSENCNKPLTKDDIKRIAAGSKQKNMLTSWLVKTEAKGSSELGPGGMETKTELSEAGAKRVKKSE